MRPLQTLWPQAARVSRHVDHLRTPRPLPSVEAAFELPSVQSRSRPRTRQNCRQERQRGLVAEGVCKGGTRRAWRQRRERIREGGVRNAVDGSSRVWVEAGEDDFRAMPWGRSVLRVEW